tara:strand:+ start:1795 stop:2841 length:1047 start_codon:yes stop_codon:yes gene_type:complete
MPIPKPNPNETKKDFMDRCMSDKVMVDEYDDKQRFAVCESQIEKNSSIMEKKLNERHIKKIVEDEKSITIVYSKTEDFEGIDIDSTNEEEIVDEDVRKECDCGKYREHIPGHVEEEEVVDEIEEEEEEEVEEDGNNYRSSKKVDVWDKKHTQEKRYFDIESRLDSKEGRDVVIGHAAVFNSLSEDLGGFREKIMPGAFDDVLSNDTRAYFNHDPNLILGRVSAGTLRLSVDEMGLRYELDIPNTSAGRDLKENMKLGNITQSSFAFTISKDGDSWERNEDGTDVRIINKVNRLYDVSPVSLPAYPSASDLALAQRSNFIDKENTRKKQENKFETDKLLNLKINLLKRK